MDRLDFTIWDGCGIIPEPYDGDDARLRDYRKALCGIEPAEDVSRKEPQAPCLPRDHTSGGQCGKWEDTVQIP